MKQSAPQVFLDIKPEQYEKLTQKAKAAGIHMSGNTGTAGKLGVEVFWRYSPDTQELLLQCLHAPFFMSSDQVDATMQTLVKESLAELPVGSKN